MKRRFSVQNPEPSGLSAPLLNNVTSTLERMPAAPPLAAVLRVTNAASLPASFVLRGGVCRLGAGEGADWIIQDSTVSRLHAELSLDPAGVQVRDLSSRNGTFVLGQRIQSAVVRLGTELHVGRAIVRIESEGISARDRSKPRDQYGALRGGSAPMQALYDTLAQLEGSLVNVLVEGESGTGKELVARAIHEHSSVARGPFVAVNCASLDRNLGRGELFGHKKGSFTGATASQIGAFELASGGTLFLDEIGELPLDVQPMLLRALETGSIVRLGEAAERPVKVRVIAATNRNILTEVQERRFREDLLYRLGVIRVRTPALRERPADIWPLAEQFAAQLGLGELSESVRRDLESRTWKGNVRELRSAITALAVLGRLPDVTPPELGTLELFARSAVDLSKQYAEQKEALLETFTRHYLELLLKKTGGNRSEAARISGLDRSYLNKLANKLD